MSSLRRCVVLGAVGFVVTLSGGYAFAQKATWESWGRQVANQIAKFLPQPVPGLTDRYPWEPGEGVSKPVMSEDCPDEACPYFPIHVFQTWRIADPELVKQVQGLEQHKAPVQKLEDIQDRVARLIQQGKYDEATKLMESMGNVMAPDPSLKEQDQDKLAKRLEAEGDQAFKLKEERTRTLEVFINVNFTPAVIQEGPNMKPIGTIKGYPLYREPKTFIGDIRDGVKLLVYLGPPDFKNVSAGPGPRMRGVVKNILVMAWTRSTKDHAKADEALARQMIEKIDYAGLAKLLAP